MIDSIDTIGARVRALKNRYAERDVRLNRVFAVRRGDLASVAGEYFPEGLDQSMVANLIDVSAKDISEVLAPLPTFSCAASNTLSDKEQAAAELRTKIVNHYVQSSKLERQMYVGADWYLTAGFVPFVVEPDYENNKPHIRIDSPFGAYVNFDRFGNVAQYVRRYTKTLAEIVADFPQFERQLIGPFAYDQVDWGKEMELVRYEDKFSHVLFVPECDNLVLLDAENVLGKVAVVVARRPDISPDDPRGQFDDVLWLQIARARYAFLHMEATEKSVQAPIAVPPDVQDYSVGPDAIIRSNQPQAIRRVGLELPTGAFSETQILESELRLGSRFPQGRSGQIDASVITGQGVQALLGGFDTQIKTGQQMFSDALQEVMSLALEMDEKLFAGKKKISATYAGAPYELEYDPAKAIKGNYSVQVRYGLMSGLDPSRALIFSLQALQGGLVSRDRIMHELPWSMDVSEVQKAIEVERLRDSLNGAFGALTQAIPQMVTQGQDASKIVMQIADVIQARKDGVSIEDAVVKVLTPEPAPEMSPAAGMPAVEPGMAQGAAPALGGPAGEQLPPELAGMAGGAAPEGQPQQPQQAPPELASILAMMGGGA